MKKTCLCLTLIFAMVNSIFADANIENLKKKYAKTAETSITLPDGSEKNISVLNTPNMSIRIEEIKGGNTNTPSQLAMAANQFLVKFKSKTSKTEISNYCNKNQFTIIKSFKNDSSLYLLSTNQSDLKALPNAIEACLKSQKLILYAEPDYLLFQSDTTPDDPYFVNGEKWGLNKISAPGAWDSSIGSIDVLIGVIDSGVNYTHEDLINNIWHNSGEDWVNSAPGNNGIDDDGNGYIDDYYGWNFLSNNNNPDDLTAEGGGHGTHIAGILGAVGNNGLGVTGVCWTTRIMCLKFLGADGGLVSKAVEAINYATANGAFVTNNSWGGFSFSQSLKDAISASGEKGVLFVSGAGNNSDDNEHNPFYPSSFDLANIISVTSTDSNDLLSSFSNYGSKSVDLAAPGESILSTYPTTNQYKTMSGTSMATPFVTGACALIKAKNTLYTSTQIKELLIYSTDKLSSLSGKCLSSGRLNLNRAINKGAIVLVSPIGDEAWQTNSKHNITWESLNFTGEIKIDLYKDDLFLLTISESTENDGTFEWLLPTTLVDANDYKIRLSDSTDSDAYDQSDANFGIGASIGELKIQDFPTNSGELTPSTNQNVVLGLPYSVSATPLDGYYFSGWQLYPENAGELLDTSSNSTSITLKEDCELTALFEIYSLSINEIFAAGTMPPTDWTKIDGASSPGDEDAHWKITSLSQYVYSGSNAALCPWGFNLDEWLITPSIDLTASSSPSLSFYWQSNYYWSVSPNNNADFLVKISLDNGVTWRQLWSFDNIGEWNSWEWQQAVVDLSLYADRSNVKLAFNIVANNNADIVLDNIQLRSKRSLDYATVTLLVSPENKGDISPFGSVSIEKDTDLTISATNSVADYYFIGWTATPATNAQFTDSSAADTTVRILGDVSITALFAQQTRTTATLTMGVSPNASGTTTPAASTTPTLGVPQSVIATPAAGYNFIAWTSTGNADVADPQSASSTVTLLGDATVTANFATSAADADSLTIKNLRVSMNNYSVAKDSLSLKLLLPDDFDSSSNNMKIMIDSWSADISAGAWDGQTYDSQDSEGKIRVTLNTKKQTLKLKVSKATLFDKINSAGPLIVIVVANDKYYTGECIPDEKTNWRLLTPTILATGAEITHFTASYQRKSRIVLEKDKVSIRGVEPQLPYVDMGSPHVFLDSAEWDLVRTQRRWRNNKYVYTPDANYRPKKHMTLNFSDGKWRFKITKGSQGDKLSRSGEINASLVVTNQTPAKSKRFTYSFQVKVKTTLTFSQ